MRFSFSKAQNPNVQSNTDIEVRSLGRTSLFWIILSTGFFVMFTSIFLNYFFLYLKKLLGRIIYYDEEDNLLAGLLKLE